MSDFQRHIPTPENYEKGIPNMIFKIYKNMYKNREDVVVPINIFKDKEKAIEVLKGFMIRGGKYLSYFNSDYSLYIIYKNEHSERFINQKIKAKAESEAESEAE